MCCHERLRNFVQIPGILEIPGIYPTGITISAIHDAVARALQIFQSPEEVVADSRPAEFHQKDENRQRNGADDQDRFQADGTSLVVVNPLQQSPKRWRSWHLSISLCLEGVPCFRTMNRNRGPFPDPWPLNPGRLGAIPLYRF